MLTLIDSSSWIEAFRDNGQPEIRSRVFTLVRQRRAAWCDPIRLELWNSRAGEAEQKSILLFEDVVVTLPMTPEVWKRCIDLAKRARSKGVTAPAVDLMIAACAFQNEISIEHHDKHFDLLLKLK